MDEQKEREWHLRLIGKHRGNKHEVIEDRAETSKWAYNGGEGGKKVFSTGTEDLLQGVE